VDDWIAVVMIELLGLVLLVGFGSMLVLSVYEIGWNPITIILLGAPTIAGAVLMAEPFRRP
jgi:hypothetical protein